jgi:type I restriction enzyme S subunit
MPLPPPREQRFIADYLDRETTQIDELIAEQQRLVSLLSERRQAAIDRVLGVRVGFGERLRWSVTEVDARAGARAVTLPLLSVSISWGVRRREDAVGEGSRAEELLNYKVCTQGDLVINRMRAFQGALGLAAEDGIVSPDYAVLNVAEDLDPQWLVAVMRTPSFVAEMAKRVRGIGSADLGNARTPRINVADLGEIRIAAPSPDQQAAEVSDLADELERLDLLMLEVERSIELSRERRSALITAAVTGQIDVGEAA